MLVRQHKSHSNIIITEIHGTFTQDDFNNIFIPQVQSILESFAEVNVFLDFDDDLTGWMILSLLGQFKQYMAYHNGINRLAVISDSSLLKWRLNFNKLNPNQLIERFAHKDTEKAKAWLAIG
ncbi:STAS/SEC14 domain-containing protein [Pseudocolwellia sp. HL-MZ19]|uniref:STAS/SEC14 domain-containing protein n=1 Tax=unclassified Pseudocolwellia TaxID=2848178 RepID=UPI003CE9CADA